MIWQRKIILLKFWLQRTMGYASIANFCMLLYLVLDKFKLTRFLIPLMILCIVAAVVFGYIEDKIGMAKEEYLIQAERMGLKE
jgi:tetrahydromethanopterin S-methyltransferase subunit E